MMFNLHTRNDGVRSKYGDEDNLELDEAVDSLLYHGAVSKNWTEDDITKTLSELKSGQSYVFCRGDYKEYIATRK